MEELNKKSVKRKAFVHPRWVSEKREVEIGLWKKKKEIRDEGYWADWNEVKREALSFIGSIKPENLISVNEYTIPTRIIETCIVVYYREE